MRNDRFISLPKRYLKAYNLNEFKTHGFKSWLIVKLNSKVIFNGLIEKSDFKNYIDKELLDYGVLSSPDVGLSGDYIDIRYSLSIPLSDVGKQVVISIDTNGKKLVLRN